MRRLLNLCRSNGRPFCIAEDSGMRVIIDPILEGIYKETGQKHTVNRVVLEQKVHEAFLIMIDRMKLEMQNKLITLMLDITTKHNRAILGINVRFFVDGRYIIRTLSMHELKKSHTASNIHQMVTETLAGFEIGALQIFAYCSDNAGNVTNVADLLNDDAENVMMEEGMNFDDQMFSLVNDQFYSDLLAETQRMFGDENSHVIYVSCAAHTLNLAVKDVLILPVFKNLMQIVKDVVKELRTPTISRILRERELKQAVIDHEIRWNSKYLMVSHIHTFST